MSAAQELLLALSEASPEHAACYGDDRFIGEPVPGRSRRQAARLAVLKSICDRCPLFDLCEQVAVATDANGGFWAGRSRDREGKMQDWGKRLSG